MLLVFTLTSHTRKTWPQKILRCKDGKKVTTEALLELAELVLEKVKQLALSLSHRTQLYLLWLTLRNSFWKTLNCSHAYGGGTSMIHFLSGNMKKILQNNSLKHLMPVTTLSNLLRNGQKKKQNF